MHNPKTTYMKPAAITLLFLFVFAGGALAQEDSIQNLYFVKKHREAVFDKKDYQPGKNAFYIYRNCRYDFVLTNKKRVTARITDIRKDSLYYTVYLNAGAAAKNKDHNDTLRLHPSQLKKIRLIGDRMMGIYSGYSLRRRRYVLTKDTAAKTFKHLTETVYAADSSRATTYELVPYLTAQGLDMLYEQCGITYYYEGGVAPACGDTVKKQKPPLNKKGVWFTPSNANRIKGVTLGLQSMHAQGEPLAIQGVNLNADALSFLMSLYSLIDLPFNNTLINMEDTVDKSGINIRVRGLSLSGGGLVGPIQMKGVSINGAVCVATETRGVVLTGSQNLADEFSGVVISTLRNKSIKGRGLQLGLLNICKDMKGIQLGLWNVNSKRRMPFINWSF